MPSLTPLMHSILDRLLQLVPEEPRVAKQLNDIIDSDAGRGGELIERAVQTAQVSALDAAHEEPASGLHPRPAVGRRAAS